MIGKILGNRYEIIKKVGGGGMALVYKAKCRLLNRHVAIKILRPEFNNDEEFIMKFKRESQAAASLSHSNIVNIYDTGVEDDIYYIVMEYIDGKTLKELIKEKGRLSSEETLNITTQIAEALNHAHRNHIVHRDIKPHNILVTNDHRIKVTDFGIARAATSSTVTNTSNVIGSVHYFSPEQARGGYTDEKSDIYSLGIVMYEMITGRVPFEGDSPITVALKHVQEEIVPPSKVAEGVPKSIEKMIMKAVEKDQSLRYNNALELIDDLKKAEECIDDDCIKYKNYSDSPTRVLPAVKDDVVMGRKGKKEKKKQPKRENKNKERLTTLAAILLALIITGGLAIGAYYMLMDYIAGEEVAVPNLVGLHEDVAKANLESLGLEMKVRSSEYNSDILEGHITQQFEEPDTVVKQGYSIDVIVSKGEKSVEVPDLVNQHSNQITIKLDSVNLIEGDVEYEFSNIPANYIISQSPEANKQVPEGSKIDFVISKGPEINYVIMPNLIGKTIKKAKDELESKGFILGETSYKVSEAEIDTVIEQSYPAESEVEEYTSINLTLSSGPEEEEGTDNGDVSDGDGNEDQNGSDDNNDDTNDTGDTIGEDEITINLPQDREEVEVKIYRIQDNDKELVYTQNHQTSTETIKVPVSGSGTVKFEVYFDGKFQGHTYIDF